jgi:toxin ParE1/3/4
MYKCVILPSAKTDLKNSSVWYETQQKGLGKKFIASIRESLSLAAQNPYAFQVRFDDVRSAVVRKFPFLIYYLVDEGAHRIIIVAIFHTSRKPKSWGTETI